jgi:pyruvate/2-oxoglutarate dehydrogenase complex dihydrolipoamide acyltransferase (E2) component
MPTRRHNGYEVRPFPRTRQLVIDAGWIAHRKHMIHGLVEVDVTESRRYIREHKVQTGETLSFTAFVVGCLGRAVDTNKHMHAYRNWRNQLILFDEVDVTMTIEIEVDDHKFPLVHIIRAANKRSFRDVHDEIRAIQAKPARSPEMSFVRLFPLLPSFVRRFTYRLLAKSPHLQKKHAGTVGLTAVGMFGTGGGWGFGMPAHTLAVTLGGIAEKPGAVDGRIEIREYLCVTLSFDHDIIDGAPAARFTQRFTDLIERGYGLIDQGSVSRHIAT